MATKIKYQDRKDGIRKELVRLARERRTVSYSELGRKFRIAVQGPWKPLLDEISHQEIEKGLPDITLLIISKQSGLPGQLGYQLSRAAIAAQRETAISMIQSIFDYYSRSENEPNKIA